MALKEGTTNQVAFRLMKNAIVTLVNIVDSLQFYMIEQVIEGLSRTDTLCARKGKGSKSF